MHLLKVYSRRAAGGKRLGAILKVCLGEPAVLGPSHLFKCFDKMG